MTVTTYAIRREIDDLSPPYAFTNDDLDTYLAAAAGESSDELKLLYVKIRCWRALRLPWGPQEPVTSVGPAPVTRMTTPHL